MWRHFLRYSMKHSNRSNTIIAFLVLTTSFAGFIDAAYLAVEHYRHAVPPCTIVSGCERVTTSVFSQIAGIPISIPGMLYYLTLFVATLIFLDSKKTWVMKWASYFTFGGLAVSLVLVYIQLFIIHAICLYCMFSALTSAILFVLGVVFLKISKSTVEDRIEAHSDILLND